MIISGDCIEEMQKLIDQGVQVDAVVTDPPYHLQSIVDRFGKEGSAPAKQGTDGAFARASSGFMGQEWDGGDIAFRAETWRLAWELLKPGGHLLAFSASRNYHRMAVAIEDAGFEIRDQMMWLYGSGFPKSMNISKAIDKAAGAEREVVGIDHAARARANKNTTSDKMPSYDKPRQAQTEAVITAPATEAAKQWDGWGTALKPAHEPIAVGRKPISESTVAKNVLKHGTGAINIDASRVETNDNLNGGTYSGEKRGKDESSQWQNEDRKSGKGSGFTHGCGEFKQPTGRFPANIMHDGLQQDWARFFYCPKVSKKERGENNKHPTVKPQELMKYLVRLVTPKGGTVLDPIMGSGSTGMAAKDLGFDFIGIEKSEEYFKICQERIDETNPLSEFFD